MLEDVRAVPDVRPPRERRRVGVADLVWLTVRQHRTLLVLSASVAALLSVAMIVVARRLDTVGCVDLDMCLTLHQPATQGETLLRLLSAVPVLVAVFWGAPLLPREYEQGTDALAWGQDVSPARWLVAKVSVLGLAATALAVVLWAVARPLAGRLLELRASGRFASAFATMPFETRAPLLVPYVLFGLAAGVAAGAVTRRTVPAIALAAAAAGGVLVTVARLARPRFLPPLKAYADMAGLPDVGRDSLLVTQNAWADAAGRVTTVPPACLGGEPFQRCLAEHGITQRVTVYQPADRLVLFQAVEALLYVVLGIACLTFAVSWLRARR